MYTVMVPVTEYLMPAEPIHGFAEDLVLAEASVEAGGGPEAGEFGGRCKLAINSLEVNCRKDGYYAKR